MCNCVLCLHLHPTACPFSVDRAKRFKDLTTTSQECCHHWQQHMYMPEALNHAFQFFGSSTLICRYPLTVWIFSSFCYTKKVASVGSGMCLLVGSDRSQLKFNMVVGLLVVVLSLGMAMPWGTASLKSQKESCWMVPKPALCQRDGVPAPFLRPWHTIREKPKCSTSSPIINHRENDLHFILSLN